eukprot:3881373-Ditylum_brightwellii.AAC.1
MSSALFNNTLNIFSTMVFAVYQQQSETYTFKDMLSQPDHKEFIAAMMDKIAVHENREHWPLIRCSDVPQSKLVNEK